MDAFRYRLVSALGKLKISREKHIFKNICLPKKIKYFSRKMKYFGFTAHENGILLEVRDINFGTFDPKNLKWFSRRTISRGGCGVKRCQGQCHADE